MGLRERKQINNLPHYVGGAEPSADKTWLQRNLYLPQNGEGWGTAITGTANLIANGANAFGSTKTASSMLSDAGQSTGYGPGFTYIRQNSPNYGKELAELSRQNTQNTLNTATAGATAGAAFGPIGAGAGFLVGGLVGLLGGGARKRKFMDQMKIAKTNNLNFNQYSFASGQSDFLANDFNVNHNVQQNDQIYHAKDGKLPQYKIGKPDAMGSNGEVAGHINPQTGQILDAYKIGKGVDFKDNVPLKLGKDTETRSSFVLTRKEDPNIGISPAELALSGDIYGALDLQKYMKNYLAYKQFKNGKLPGFVLGKDGEDNEQYDWLLSAPLQLRDPFDGRVANYAGYESMKRRQFDPNKVLQLKTPIGLGSIALPSTSLIKPSEYSMTYNPGLVRQPESKYDVASPVGINNKVPGDLSDYEKEKIYNNIEQQKQKAYNDYHSRFPSYNNIDAGLKRSSSIIPAMLSVFGIATANSTRSTGEGDAQPTFVDNDRAQQALNIMNNRKTDTYAQQTALRDAESRARYDSRTKGTSIGSYALQAAANHINTLKQIAQANALGQEAYNKLAGEKAQMMAQLGESKASRMQQSNQNWREMLHRAKSLKYTLDNNAKAQMLGQAQYGYKNIFDLNKWLDTMGLYNQDYALRADEMRRRYLL